VKVLTFPLSETPFPSGRVRLEHLSFNYIRYFCSILRSRYCSYNLMLYSPYQLILEQEWTSESRRKFRSSSFCTLQLVGNGKAAGRSGATNAALQPSFDLRRLLYVLFDRLAGRWPDWTRQYRCGFMIWDEAPSCTLAVLLIEDNQASAGCYEFLIYQIDCHKYNHKNQRLSHNSNSKAPVISQTLC
jgi:hypothetical protein